MALFFVFLMKIGVITYCSSVVADWYSHRAEAFPVPHAALPARGWGEGTQPGQGAQAAHRDVKHPYPNPCVVTLLPSRFSPHPSVGSEQSCLQVEAGQCPVLSGCRASPLPHHAPLGAIHNLATEIALEKKIYIYLEMSSF